MFVNEQVRVLVDGVIFSKLLSRDFREPRKSPCAYCEIANDMVVRIRK